MIVEILITLLIIFLVYASCNIRSNIYLKVFCKKQTEDKIVAITFDDGPDPVQTPKVLQVLKEQQILACFFCIGHKVEENEELIRKIINEGHLIGNHSFTHTHHFALDRVTSQKIKLFRPPFGVTNPTIAKAVRILGYTPVGWNIRTLDTLQPSKEKVLKRIQKRLRPGSIILLHDRMPDSDLLLKEILNLIKEQGYTVVRLDSML